MPRCIHVKLLELNSNWQIVYCDVDKIVCIEEDEAQGFVEVINEAMNRIGEITLVYSDQDGYYSYDVASIITSITDVTESVKEKYGENPTVCEEDATDDEVRKAYRKMALQYHPDRVATLGDDVKEAAKKKFQELNDAKDRIYKARNL